MIQKPDEPYPDFRSHREYPDLRSVDVAIGRAWLRLGIHHHPVGLICFALDGADIWAVAE